MTIYILLFSVMVFFWFGIQGHTGRERSIWMRWCFRLCTVLLVIFAILRGASVGTDTAGYVKDYNLIQQFTYKQILTIYTENAGYYLLSKIFADFGVSVHIWFGVIELLFVGVVSKLIKRFSKDTAFSYIMFLSLGYYAFSLAGLKQVWATTFILKAFLYLYDEKYIRYFICLMVGSLFHVSGLVFILAFAIALLRRSKALYPILTIAFVICALSYSSILNTILAKWNNEHYSGYLESEGAYSATNFIVQVILLLVSFLYMKSYRDENEKEANMLYGLSYLGVIMQLFAFEVASAFRVSMYFSIFLILLVPNCVSLEKNIKIKYLFKFFAIIIFVFFFMYTNRNGGSVVPYVFYWSE